MKNSTRYKAFQEHSPASRKAAQAVQEVETTVTPVAKAPAAKPAPKPVRRPAPKPAAVAVEEVETEVIETAVEIAETPTVEDDAV